MTLQFSKNKTCNRYTFAELTEIQRNQFLVTCKNTWGPRHSLYEALQKSESNQMVWEYFEITNTQTNQTAYQAWILGDDCGTFFVANTIEQIEIEMSQSCISPMDEEHEEFVALADSLEKAYHKAPSVFRDAHGFNVKLFEKYWKELQEKKEQDKLGKEHWVNYFEQFTY